MNAVQRVVLAAISLALLTGCAHTHKQPEPIFFPPEPAEPRLQYLMSFSRPEDVEPGPSMLRLFLLGRPAPKPPLSKPYGGAIAGGLIYVCDTQSQMLHEVDVANRTWSYFTPSHSGALGRPINMDVTEEGKKYVADAGRGQVFVYSAENRNLGTVGAPQSMRPTDVKVRGGRIYVSDAKSHEVRVFDEKTRNLVLRIPQGATNSQERLFTPTNLDLGSDGSVYVSDTGSWRVQKYDATGRYVRSFGGLGDTIGMFARNRGVAVDREGRIYVADAATQVVQIFDKDGQVLLYFGEPGGSPVPLVFPAGLIIDYDHVDLFEKYAAPGFEIEYLVISICQFGTRLVNVFGFGRLVK